jgi:hypothetical protein
MKRLTIDAILYPIYSWQGTWSHVHGLSSNQMPTIFSAVVHVQYDTCSLSTLVYSVYINFTTSIKNFIDNKMLVKQILFSFSQLKNLTVNFSSFERPWCQSQKIANESPVSKVYKIIYMQSVLLYSNNFVEILGYLVMICIMRDAVSA